VSPFWLEPRGSPGRSFVDGLTPAIWIGAVSVAVAALVARAIPRKRPSKERLAPAIEKA
jgi:hypothetical protein